jgi:hypothetical protein
VPSAARVPHFESRNPPFAPPQALAAPGHGAPARPARNVSAASGKTAVGVVATALSGLGLAFVGGVGPGPGACLPTDVARLRLWRPPWPRRHVMSTAFTPMPAHTRVDGSLELDTEKSVSDIPPPPEDFRALLALNLLRAFKVALPITLLHNRPPFQEALGLIILMAASACAGGTKVTLRVGRGLGTQPLGLFVWIS